MIRLRFLKRPIVWIPLTILLPMWVVACAGSNGGAKANTPAAGATAIATGPSVSAANTPRTQIDDLRVTTKEFSFTLSLTSIHKGPPGVHVSLQNDGAEAHSIAFYIDGNFNKPLVGATSDNVTAGASADFSFIPLENATIVYYRCDIHPTQMHGELNVESR